MSSSKQEIAEYKKLKPEEKMQKIREYATAYHERNVNGEKQPSTKFGTFIMKEAEDRQRLQGFKSADPGSWDDTMAAVLVTLHCWTCFERSKELKKCSRCRVAVYCSPKCQRDDWSCPWASMFGKMFSGHKEYCTSVKKKLELKVHDTESEQKIAEYQKLNPEEKLQKIREWLQSMSRGTAEFDEEEESKDGSKENEFDAFMEKEADDRSRLQSFKSADPGSWDGTNGALLVSMHCWTCFKRCKTLKKCCGCRVAVYCSDNCQSEDWSRPWVSIWGKTIIGHKEYCNSVKKKLEQQSKKKVEQQSKKKLKQQNITAKK